jgi:hypothetical protein
MVAAMNSVGVDGAIMVSSSFSAYEYDPSYVLALLGIRNFKPTLRKAAERLATVHTPEGMPLPPTPWPSCSAIWRGWALLSARSEKSKKLARNG